MSLLLDLLSIHVRDFPNKERKWPVFLPLWFARGRLILTTRHFRRISKRAASIELPLSEPGKQEDLRHAVVDKHNIVDAL